jgi:hypothetical protein
VAAAAGQSHSKKKSAEAQEKPDRKQSNRRIGKDED